MHVLHTLISYMQFEKNYAQRYPIPPSAFSVRGIWAKIYFSARAVEEGGIISTPLSGLRPLPSDGTYFPKDFLGVEK